ncbi:hypothetical protein MTO96_032123 [Rhipicephalus appendiculatus]
MPIEVLIVAVVPLLTIGTWFTYAPNYIPVLAQSLLERIGFGAQGVRAGSPAARFQARFKPYTGKGSIFAVLRRWRKHGIPEWLKMLILALGTMVLLVISAFVMDILIDHLLVKYVY